MGMDRGKKKDRNTDHASVRLDDDARRELEEMAARNDRTLSAEIRRAVREYIARNKGE